MPVTNGFAHPASTRVAQVGTTGGNGAAPLNQGEIAGEGASETGANGQKKAPAQVSGAAGSQEFQTTNTLAEERQKKLRASMYPSATGSR